MSFKVSSVIGLFCLIAAVYQIYGITKFYLQFEVRNDVAYDYSTYIELPAIDIIVPVFMAMDWTKLFARYPEKMQDFCEKLQVKYKGSNYTIDNRNKNCERYIYLMFLEKAPFVTSDDLPCNINVRRIKEDTYDLRERMRQITITSYNSRIFWWRYCKLIRYYNGLALFLRILCLNGTKPFSVNSNYVSLNEGIVASIIYSFGIHFGIRFSDPADLPEYDPSKYFMITSKPGSFPLVTISFVKTVMSSLELPYETNCRHYNRDKSISKCMTEYTLSQSPPYLDKYSVHDWDEHPSYLGFNGDNENDGNKVNLGEVNAFTNCNQQAAATECDKTSYLVEGKLFEESDYLYSRIIIAPSWKVNMYRSVHPVLPWDEYVIYIGSIVGFWFGVSMYDLILKIFIHIKTRCLNFRCR